jgi:hypothetical protein
LPIFAGEICSFLREGFFKKELYFGRNYDKIVADSTKKQRCGADDAPAVKSRGMGCWQGMGGFAEGKIPVFPGPYQNMVRTVTTVESCYRKAY